LKITLGTLKDEGEELSAFLEPRVGAKLSVSSDSIEIEDGSIRAGVRPRHVKTYIKRFMYIKGIRKNFRVFVSGGELTIQEIELGKEEEEEKEKKPAEKREKEVVEERERVDSGAEEERSPQQTDQEPKAIKTPGQRKPSKKSVSKKKQAVKKKAESED